jgi:hypothetical protein
MVQYSEDIAGFDKIASKAKNSSRLMNSRLFVVCTGEA